MHLVAPEEEGGAMVQLQVMLKGENWRLRLLVCLLLLLIALIVLEVWLPGSLASVFSAIKNTLVRIYEFCGDIFHAFKRVVSTIGSWYR
jgi:hypothetical protein